MTITRAILPFTAVVGQASMKQALVLNAINPAIGGVIIRGERGTAKSTAARALAALLPEQRVLAGCRFGCSPDEGDLHCFECRERIAAGETIEVTSRRMHVVELPINASEDRVVGAIDIEAAIRRGERRFEPGVLAEANRNILYVDEVNLLDDHIVDVLLDAAAMGINIVEREGISVDHPSRFILVGTMNPEEGELRPQLLDRFGLCVDVAGLRTVDERVAVIEQDALQREHPQLLYASHAAGETSLARAIARAQQLVESAEMPSQLRHLAVLMCIDAGVHGHRADIVIHRTARALAAWRTAEHGSAVPPRVTSDDVLRAAELALAHRRTERSPERPSGTDGTADRTEQRPQDMPTPQTTDDAPTVIGTEDAGGDAGSTDHGEQGAASSQATEGAESQSGSPEASFAGDIFGVRRIQLPRDRRQRRSPGKRSVTRSDDRRGRYVGSTQSEHTTDVAFDATLRAAAPHQPWRRAADTDPDAPLLRLERQDLRQKVRERRTGTLIVFVVDASASMDAEQRMQATKGAILSLLRDAYVRRDKVALVVFSGRTARIVLRPTSSVDLAGQRLEKLTVGGTTPLTHGLVAGLKLIRTERLRDPTVYPLLVLISDGRGNISLFGDEPLIEAQNVAAQIHRENVRSLVIDSARDSTQHAPLPAIGGGEGRQPLFSAAYNFNACLDLAERLGGTYHGLYDLSQGAIVQTVERSLRGW